MGYDRLFTGAMLALLFVAAVLLAGDARSHDAPTGWSYPLQCCSLQDCRPVPSDWIDESGGDFRIVPTDEHIAMSDPRIKQSKDENWHWCSVAGSDDSRTICLFVPDRGY